MLVDDRGILTRPRGSIQDPLPELRRGNLSDCERQPGRGLAQVAYIARAKLAALQVALEALALGVIQSVKRVGATESMRVCAAGASRAHPQAVAHPDQAVADPGLDRPECNVEQPGDLAVGVAAVVGEGDRLTLQVRQRVQATAYPFPVKAGLDGLGDLVR
jgi:hypothetical protein